MTPTKQLNIPNGGTHSMSGSLWFRENPMLPSKKVTEAEPYGFTCTNIDLIWRNYTTNHWYTIEAKTNGCNKVDFTQMIFLRKMDELFSKDPTIIYTGTWLVTFEHTSPDDGYTLVSKLCSDGNDAPQFRFRYKLLDSMAVTYFKWFLSGFLTRDEFEEKVS